MQRTKLIGTLINYLGISFPELAMSVSHTNEFRAIEIELKQDQSYFSITINQGTCDIWASHTLEEDVENIYCNIIPRMTMRSISRIIHLAKQYIH